MEVKYMFFSVVSAILVLSVLTLAQSEPDYKAVNLAPKTPRYSSSEEEMPNNANVVRKRVVNRWPLRQNLAPGVCPLECNRLIEDTRRQINDLEGQLNLAKGGISKLDEDVDKLKRVAQRLEQQDQDIQKNVDALRNDVKQTDQQIAEIKTQTSIPVGYVYVQYPQQPPPSTIWPQYKWTEVTSKYAGMFFRAEGGGSAPFGNVQNADTSRVTKMFSGGFGANQVSTTRDVPAGTWSAAVDTGGNGGQKWGLQLYTEGAENRPKNMAIRVWVRAQ